MTDPRATYDRAYELVDSAMRGERVDKEALNCALEVVKSVTLYLAITDVDAAKKPEAEDKGQGDDWPDDEEELLRRGER